MSWLSKRTDPLGIGHPERETDMEQWMSEATRAWLYRVAGAVQLLLVGYGVMAEEQGALWLALVAALLGTGTAAVAARHTSTKRVSDDGH